MPDDNCVRQARTDPTLIRSGVAADSAAAADSLSAIIQNEAVPSSARVSAIRLALDFSYRGMSIDQLINRLNALEEQLEQSDSYPVH